MPDAEYDELSTFGFSRRDIDSINDVWTILGAGVLLHPTADELRLGGNSPSQALDAINHGLDASTAEDFIAFGFTAHQGRLISLSERAYDNMLGQSKEHLDYVLDVDVPNAHLTNVLLLASDPEEVRTMLARYVRAKSGDAETHDSRKDTPAYLSPDPPMGAFVRWRKRRAHREGLVAELSFRPRCRGRSTFAGRAA